MFNPSRSFPPSSRHSCSTSSRFSLWTITLLVLTLCQSLSPLSALAETPPPEKPTFEDGEILEREPCKWPSFTDHGDWVAFMKKGVPALDDRLFETYFTEQAYERYRRGEDTQCEKIVYGSDGLRIRGFLVQPTSAPEPRPVVIYNRGGFGEYGRIRFWNVMQMHDLAARGYVVLASEYRGTWGSEGRDEGDGADVADVLHLLTLADRLPQADGERVGMLGWSRGGGMTYQALARTERLSAAIIVAGGTDSFDSALRRPDAAAALEPIMFPDGNVAWERLMRSPLRWPERLHRETPILILHGASDWRVHPGQSLAMVQRLFELKIPVRFVLFEGNDHMLSEHFSDAWQQIVSWLDRYVRDQTPWPSLEPHGN